MLATRAERFMTADQWLKAMHLVGVVLLVGNVTVSAVWKALADRTGDVRVMAYAQRLITLTDWTLTGAGIALTLGGGYGMVQVGRLSATRVSWLVWGIVATIPLVLAIFVMVAKR